MAITIYQLERIGNVRSWYEQTYQTLSEDSKVSVRYLVLWSVFNALYNIADYPKIALKSVSDDEGKIKPFIRGRDDDKKLRFISRKLSINKSAASSIINNHLPFINLLASRKPEVNQPPGTTNIQFIHNGMSYVIDLSNLFGIASIDNRMFLADGTVLFQYHHLDIDFNEDDFPKDPPKFFRQLLFILYQLRNNIIHGGSATFFMEKTELAIGAIRLLDEIVQYILNNPELLDQDRE